MRIALISDLHGNHLALEAVLADARRAGVDRLACLGDVATLGPRPREVLERLADLGCPCILGNHDEFLLDPAVVERYTRVPIIVEAIDWCRAQLGPGELAFVGGFDRELELDLGGGARLLLFHGSPDDNTCDLLATTPPDELEQQLGERRATLMAGGHTHIQLLRQHRGALLLNPGSVGMPFREYVAGARPVILAHAEYAIVDAADGRIGVDLRRVPLDKCALRKEAAAWPHALMLRSDMLQQYA